MDRLTMPNNEGMCMYEGKPCCPDENCTDICLQERMKKLWKYENLEEQGLLLRLPCKVGETILRQREKLTQIEMRVLENFIRCMSTTYRKYNRNWNVVQDILMHGTLTAGQTSCMEKCRELGIDPDGYTLGRVKV